MGVASIFQYTKLFRVTRRRGYLEKFRGDTTCLWIESFAASARVYVPLRRQASILSRGIVPKTSVALAGKFGPFSDAGEKQFFAQRYTVARRFLRANSEEDSAPSYCILNTVDGNRGGIFLASIERIVVRGFYGDKRRSFSVDRRNWRANRSRPRRKGRKD